jgi:hypothetical protein
LAVVVVTGLGSASAEGQSGAPSQAAVAARPDQSEMVTTVNWYYTRGKTLFTQMADKMPAEAYEFKPAPEMRSFAAALGHIAMSNINQCGTLLGRKHALAGQDLTKTLTTKADTVKALADTFAFCDEYFSALKASSQLTGTFFTPPPRPGQPEVKVPHGAMVTSFVAHNYEMYGYLAVYLRLKGIVPPSSER